MKIGDIGKNKRLSILVLLIFVFSNFVVGIDSAFASFNTVYVNLSSQVGGASSVTYTFHMKPSVTQAIKQINLKFCTQAGTYGATCTAPTGLVLPATNNVTLTGYGSNTQTATAASNVESVVITAPASETTATDHTTAIAAMTNPTTQQVYFVRIQTYSDTGATVIDEADIGYAMIPAVSMSASNLESLTFTISAVTSATALNNGSGQSTDATSTVNPNTVPFGNFKGAVASTNVAHLVSVATNGASGYTLTLQGNQVLTSASNTIADFGGGTTGADAGTAWSEASTTGLGINAKSLTGSEVSTTTFGTDAGVGTCLYKKLDAGYAVIVSSAAGQSIGYSNQVDYRVAVPTTQQAGNYSNTLTYTVLTTY